MPASRAIFISYARDDLAVAQRLAEALGAAGLEVWFDLDELTGGDVWDRKIRGQIRDCTLFIPVVSAHTQARREGYFRLEWKLADERTHQMAEGTPFIVPVVTDDTKERDALVPASFLAAQWTRLPSGAVPPAFCARVQTLLADGAMEPGRTRPGQEDPRGNGAASPPRPSTAGRAPRRRHLVLAAAVPVLALAGVSAWLLLRRSPPVSEPVAQRHVPPAPEKSAPVINDKAIAVLPFENLSPDKENEFFASGMREEILAALQTVRELRVLQYRGAPKPMRQIGEELRAAFALECSVRRAGSTVRVTAKLTRAQTEEQAWVRTFTKELTDVFQIQSELATAIAGELRVAIAPGEKSSLERRPTKNVAAYDLYLKARDITVRSVNSAGVMERVETLLRGAVELDPQFALAWGELAYSHGFRFAQSNERSERQKQMATSALATMERLAPDDPETVRQRGNYHYFVTEDFPAALTSFQQLVRLRPNDPESYYSLCQVQRRRGDWRECLENFNKAIGLDPLNDRLLRNHAYTLDYGRRYAEALALHQRRIEADPKNQDAIFEQARIRFRINGTTAPGQIDPRGSADEIAGYSNTATSSLRPGGGFPALGVLVTGVTPAIRGEYSRREAQLTARLATEPTNAIHWINLADCQLVLGRSDDALRSAAKALELTPPTKFAIGHAFYAMRQAALIAWSGDTERALREFDHLLTTTGLSVHYLRYAPLPPALKNDPRFEALLNDPKNNAPLF